MDSVDQHEPTMIGKQGDALSMFCVQQLMRKLRTYLLHDFCSFLKAKGQNEETLRSFKKTVLEKNMLKSFLLQLLSCNDGTQCEMQQRKEVLREYLKAFKIPLGLRHALVNKALSMVTGWNSWSVLKGNFESCPSMTEEMAPLRDTVILGGLCTKSTFKSSDIEVFEVYCPAWGPKSLALVVVKSGRTEDHNVTNALHAFLELCLRWIQLSGSRLHNAHFVQQIKEMWFLVVDSPIIEVREHSPSQIRTLSLDNFLYKGLLNCSTQNNSIWEQRLRMISLLESMYESLEAWYSVEGDLSSNIVQSNQTAIKALELSLNNFDVTFLSHTSSTSLKSGQSIDIVSCRLQPIPLSFNNGSSNVKTLSQPPEVYKSRALEVQNSPIKNRSSHNSNSTQESQYLSTEESDCGNDSPPSVLKSSSTSATISNPQIQQTLSALQADTYSLAIMSCMVLKERLLTAGEVADYRQAYDYYTQDLLRSEETNVHIPSYYAPNIENLVNNSLLKSCLWPRHLQMESNILERKGTENYASEEYALLLLEFISELKCCLRFRPSERLGMHNRNILKHLLTVLSKVKDKIMKNWDREKCKHTSHTAPPAKRLKSTCEYFRTSDKEALRLNLLISLARVIQRNPTIVFDQINYTTLVFHWKCWYAKKDRWDDINGTWNYLLLLWKFGKIRPAQVLYLLHRIRQRFNFQSKSNQAKLSTETDKLWELSKSLVRVSDGDIEIAQLKPLKLSLRLCDTRHQWTTNRCGLTPAEALGINSLAIYIAENKRDLKTVCIESKTAEYQEVFTYSANYESQFENKGLQFKHEFSTERNLPRGSFCCVDHNNNKIQAVWVTLAQDENLIWAETVGNGGLLLTVGEVLEIPAYNHKSPLSQLSPESSATPLFVNKVIWCSTVRDDEQKIGKKRVMTILLKGRWLNDHGLLEQHSYINGQDSDDDTISLDDTNNYIAPNDSDSEVSDHGSSPAALVMFYFFMIVTIDLSQMSKGLSKHIVTIQEVYSLRNIYHDQEPTSIALIDGNDKCSTFVVVGSNGLVGKISVQHSTLADSITSFLEVVHLNSDEYMRVVDTEPILHRQEYVNSAACPHHPQAMITALSFNSGLSRAEKVIASGDSDGRVCLWQCINGSRNFKHEIKLLTQYPLKLDGGIDSLVVAPFTTNMVHIIACTKWGCYLLCGEISEVSQESSLFIKSVLDTSYQHVNMNIAAQGFSLCPRYVAICQADIIFLWRVMRSSNSPTGIDVAQRTILLGHQSFPEFLPTIKADYSNSTTEKEKSSLRQHLKEIISSNEYALAWKLLESYQADYLPYSEVLAWRTFINQMLQQKSLSCGKINRTCRQISSLTISTGNKFWDGAKLLDSSQGDHLEELKDWSIQNPENGMASISPERFKAHHMAKLNATHRQSAAADGFTEGKEGSSNSSLLIHRFQAVSSSNEKQENDLIAFVEYQYQKDIATGIPAVSIFDRNRGAIKTIEGHLILKQLYPLLSPLERHVGQHEEGINKIKQAEQKTTSGEYKISSMTFTSCGRYLLVAISFPSLAALCTCLIDAPANGIVIWDIEKEAFTGAVLCHDPLWQIEAELEGITANDEATLNQCGREEQAASTPPRPSPISFERPFGQQNERKLNKSDIDRMFLTDDDTMLKVEINGGKCILYFTVEWSDATEILNDKDSTLHEESSHALEDAEEKRYLQSSNEYFSRVLRSKNIWLNGASSRLQEFSHRIASKLMKSVEAWLCEERPSKVFTVHGAHEIENSMLMKHISAHLQEGKPSTEAVLCTLPAQQSIMSALFGRDRSGSSTESNYMTKATYPEIALDVILQLADQLTKIFGQKLIIAMLRGLATEITIHNDTKNNLTKGYEEKTSIHQVDNDGHCSHRRNFSTEVVEMTSPPPMFPTYCFTNMQCLKNHDANGGQPQEKHEKRVAGTPKYLNSIEDYLLFADMLCATSTGIMLSPQEKQALAQPTGIITVPNFRFISYLPVSRLFQIFISDPLREIDLHHRNAPVSSITQVVLILENFELYQKTDSYNQVQAVIEMALRSTPSWFRIITSSSISLDAQHHLERAEAAKDIFCSKVDTTHFVVAANCPARNPEDKYILIGQDLYQLDLNDAVKDLLQQFPFQNSAWLNTRSRNSSEQTTAETSSSISSTVTSDLERHELCHSEDTGSANLVKEWTNELLKHTGHSLLGIQLLQFLLDTEKHSKRTHEVSKQPDILATLQLFDLNTVIEEKILTICPDHTLLLVKYSLEILTTCFEPPPLVAIQDMLKLYSSSDSQVLSTLLSMSDILLFKQANDGGGQGEADLKISLKTHVLKQYWRQRSQCPLFGLDQSRGHSLITWLYLAYSSNKSIAVDHAWQSYLKVYGPSHLHRSSRFLSSITGSIRKIDETSGIKGPLPLQLGYITGLQEIYARRVGIYGPLPATLGCLHQLRVLSMGNNKISGQIPKSLGNLKHLQRIVLHQNKLSGEVPRALGRLGCIVNLAGNPSLVHGEEVSDEEKYALRELFRSTGGYNWISNTGWADGNIPVSQWYKVGVLASEVHSIVMSSNNMVGHLPDTLFHLQGLRMIELATMPGLRGSIPTAICQLVNLRRLCICRCAISGVIPDAINQLLKLEELQLFGNHLSGPIPSAIGDLVNLRLLSLGEYTGGNNFTPAPLPSCLSKLRKLEALFMANCRINGQLPNWIGNLSELRQLDLQRNAIVGTVPSGFQHLKSLLYLNLKDNQGLSGPLPLYPLARLRKLNRLSLVHCGFEVTEDRMKELQQRLPRCRIWV